MPPFDVVRSMCGPKYRAMPVKTACRRLRNSMSDFRKCFS
jgi:hypothetical protein